MSLLELSFPSDDQAVDTVIVPRSRDLGGFDVRRALPHGKRQMVGPFIFLDHFGPAEFAPGEGIDVRPHPHIGLSTVSYLYQGGMQHFDSLGSNQIIQPGEINWMTAGRGIVHSERSVPEMRATGYPISGFQTWVALPKDKEEMAPGFDHHKPDELPTLSADGLEVKILMGEMYGERSPVNIHSPLFYVDVAMQAGAQLPFDERHLDRAFFVVEGQVQIGGETFGAGQLVTLKPDLALSIKALERSQLLLLGGEPFDEPRHIWWNYVSSDLERLEQAKQDWKNADWANGPFSLPPEDNGEFIPLPSN